MTAPGGGPAAVPEMQGRLAGVPVPAARDEAYRQLHHCFTAVVGVELADPTLGESVYRPELAHGGMSSRHVHLPTWREQLLPLLLDRITGPRGRGQRRSTR
jgi:hypothetical protein